MHPKVATRAAPSARRPIRLLAARPTAACHSRPVRQRRWAAPLVLILLTIGASCGPTATPTPTAWLPTLEPSPKTTATPRPTSTPPPTLPPPAPLGLLRLWRADTADTVWDLGQAEIPGETGPAIWAASYDHSLYLLDRQGRTLWRFPGGGPLYTALAADLEGDGQPEFLLGGDDDTVHALSADGKERWSYEAGGRVTHLAATDVDRDGLVEVLAATWDGRLHILSAAGEVETGLDLGGMPTALQTRDLDGDGSGEVVVGTEAGRLVAQSASGQVLWELNLEGPVQALVTGDLDGDGYSEVLAAGRNGLVGMIGADGVPQWARRLGGTAISLAAMPQAGLVLVGKADRIVGLKAAEGQTVWETFFPSPVWTMVPFEFGGEPVLAAGGDGGEIQLLNALGQVRGSIALPSRVHGLVTADLDGDALPELLARSGDYVYALAVGPEGESGEGPPSKVTMPRWPDPSPLPPLPEGRISVLAVGDVMLSRSIEERMRAYGADYPFRVLAPLTRQADIALANLECALALGGKRLDKPYIFRAHPDMGAGLQAAGFDVVSLANNHSPDYGPEGLAETIAALQRYGLRAVGAGLQALEPVFLEVRGIHVAILARNVIGPPQPDVAYVQDEAALRRDVQRARARADVVILLLHAGAEYGTQSNTEQRLLSRAAVEAGADLVIGSHTHTTLETEEYQGGFIAYGLGDYVFDIDIVDAARDGAVLWAVFTREGLVRVDWIPTRIVNDAQPRPLPAPGGRVAIEPLLVRVSEPLLPAALSTTYILTATMDSAGSVELEQQVVLANRTGDSLADLVFFVFPNTYSGTFALQQVRLTWGGQTVPPSYTLARSTLHLFLPQRLPAGEVVTVTLRYSLAPPPLDATLWPPENNLGRSVGVRYVQLGHFYPQLVPYRPGYGWQTWEYQGVGDPFYADLASYRVTISVPAGYGVWGSGRREQEGERWHFSCEAVRDFALLVARDFAEATIRVGEIEVTSAYRREHAAAGLAVLQDVATALALFQEKYGPYPYKTFLVVEGDMNGGMEYGTMALVGSPFYESYQGEPTAILPGLAVHELAHQWWYGVVGNDQVHEPWLDESLARYSEVLFYEAVYSDTVEWWWQNRIDRWNPTGPLDASIYDYAETADYVHNLYGRGAHFIQDLRQRMGDEAFFRFLQRYYREYAWQRVTRRDFFRLVGEMGVGVEDLVRRYFQR